MANVSDLFFKAAESECLYARISPTPEQMLYLQGQHNEVADHLRADAPHSLGFKTETWIQGSYKYGTLLKPFEGEEFDVDLGFYFLWSNSDAATPDSLRLNVQSSLEQFGVGNSEVLSVERPAKKRCCRIRFRNDFHVDVPVYHFDANVDKRELAVEGNKWESSDPKRLYKWIRDRVMPDHYTQLRRIICYLKAWSRLYIPTPARPASILITILAVYCYLEAESEIPNNDDAALTAVAEYVARRLRRNRKVLNPVDPNEDLNRLSDGDLSILITRFDALEQIGKSANLAKTRLEASLFWAKAFRYMMPLAKNEQVLIKEASQGGGGLVVQPTISMNVTDRASHKPIGTFVNNFNGPIRKNSNIHFRVLNDHAFPADAIYRWTVRNADDEAAEQNDMGHESAGQGKTFNDEHTSYNGAHHMDLQIENSQGQILAFRRVTVPVAGEALRPRYRSSSRPKLGR